MLITNEKIAREPDAAYVLQNSIISYLKFLAKVRCLFSGVTYKIALL